MENGIRLRAFFEKKRGGRQTPVAIIAPQEKKTTRQPPRFFKIGKIRKIVKKQRSLITESAFVRREDFGKYVYENNLKKVGRVLNSIEAGFRSTTLIRSGANNGFDALRKSSGRFAANARPPSSYADGSRRYRAGIGFNVLRKISTETLKRKLACFGVALSACGVRAILALPLAALIYCGGSYAQAIGGLVSLVSARSE